ncbi:hypothetical protein [Marinobacterium iners]|uniref:Uncharacterized protein n=1 Tax=Marinobacterium iners DSM 11526 TaxID=1122198 RepID=A0A1H4HAD3_9GAMM|nr:hypothetical protein [Marinobacterium iners]SEB18764.1 hypothetical protein SAMN02745729_1375 [Marinobacterium iners DSM 11526]
MSLPVNESKGRQIQKFGISATGYDNRPHTLSEYLTFSRTLLEKLQEIHPLFRRLAVLGKDDYQPISEDLEGLDALIVDGAIRSVDNLKDCQNLAPDGLPGPDTTNNIGFRVSYFSYADDAERSHRPVHEGGSNSLSEAATRVQSPAAAISDWPYPATATATCTYQPW